jgi:Cft2 family RNA processing exonuclease
MNYIDLNRHGQIGASCHYLELGPFKLLVDAGLHPKELGAQAMPDFRPAGVHDLDLIVLTHCHLDHVGSLPVVAELNPEAPVISSVPNMLLAPRMLRNSINVMRRQREELGIREYPLFNHRAIQNLTKQMQAQRYQRGEVYSKNGEQMEVVLHPAGHVIGAAAVEFIYQGQRVLFSGDVLFEDQYTILGADLPKYPLDLLVLETTRGGYATDASYSRQNELQKLLLQIETILDRGGSCLIPVFALGRMQELFKCMHEAQGRGRLRSVPIFAAGLGMDLCNYFDQIHRRYVDFDLHIIEDLKIRLLDMNLRPGRNLKKQGIYIVSSGMLVEHTPSYKVAASLLPHPQNGICFVGYCDPDTPGGRLLKTQAATFFFEALDYVAPIKASIDQFDLSGHANREQLLNYAVASKAKSIVLTHGEMDARAWFFQQLGQQMGFANIVNPEPLKTYVL